MYFKKIHIENLEEFQNNILKKLPQEAFTTSGVMPQWTNQLRELPEIQNIINQLNLESIATHVCIVTMPPNSELPIHVDGGVSKAALNIPLLNCTGTYTRWFSSTQDPHEHVHHGGGTYLGVDRETCTEVATVEMDQPCVININTFHDAKNPCDTWRMLISVRLQEYQF